jgi:hypothetical protein
VTCTRLPTAAKHSAIGTIANAPATSASGAAAPICSASEDGMRKMPPPTMELMTAADSANMPIARNSAASPCSAGPGGREFTSDIRIPPRP